MIEVYMKRFVTFFLLSVLNLCCYAFFDRDLHLLNMQNGLADNTIYSIFKDRNGFMWFGTSNGISRFDGRDIKNFTSEKNNLSVLQIKEVSPYCLGILSNETLHCFNRRTETFIPVIIDLKPDTQLKVTGFLPTDKNKCWIISEHKLILYGLSDILDKKGQIIGISLRKEKEFNRLIKESERFSQINYTNNQQGLCLTTSNTKLVLFNPERPQSCKTIQLSDKTYLSITHLMECDSIIWVSTISQGVYYYDMRSDKVNHIINSDSKNFNALSHTDVFRVIKINNGRYLCATWSGYTLFIPDKNVPGRFTTEVYNNTASLLYRNIETRMISVYYDPDGVIWIGTRGGGVIYSDLRSQYYNQYHQQRHNEICGIEVDDKQHVWIATFHLGIMRSEEPFSSTETLKMLSVGTSEVRSKETVLCSFKDKEGTLWFGNADGTLTSYNAQADRFTIHVLQESGNTNQAPVWSLSLDKEQRIWVGTQNGLWLFNPLAQEAKRIPIEKQMGATSEVLVRSIAETFDGSIWIAAPGYGLCRINKRTDGTFTLQKGYEKRKRIGARYIQTLLAAKDSTLYIGYTEGFAVLSPLENSIKNFYTTKDGLCNNYVGCLAEDKDGHIWLGTNSGVVRFSRHLNLFYNYYISGSNRSALSFNEYLFWGNNKSLTFFKPGDLEAYSSTHGVQLTDLEINNRSVGIGENVNGQIVLQKGISFLSNIRLSNANRDFALTFNNLSYAEEQQKYAYRLLPYQQEWQVGQKRMRASYTNLPEGNYTFEVATLYPDGTKGEITRLGIEIEPHWSHSLFFRLFIFITVVIGLVYLWYRVKRRQKRLELELKMRHELEMLNVERNRERQILMERENFFTTAAHELRTPLTLILSPLQELLKQTQPSSPIYNKLLTMYKNGSSLHTLVDHFLYLQKIEAGMVRLHLSEVDIAEFLVSIIDSFQEIAGIRGINLTTIVSREKRCLWIDTEKIASAIRNLLSNALKYTSEGGKIQVKLSWTTKNEHELCRISVSDTGVGISPELKDHIFDSFITGTNQPGISTKIGIGLRIVKNTIDLHHGYIEVDSVVREGTTFTLFIPEGKTHFTTDECETTIYVPQVHTEKEDILVHSLLEHESVDPHESKKKLLIIEDNVSMRTYIASLFRQKFNVIEASDGEEGVEAATKQLPDCIISDVMMPKKDGFTCCREIRERIETSHIPILLLTAKAEDVDRLKGSQSGADDFMMKPFNPELLVVKVDQLIIQRERLKRIYTKSLMLKQECESEEKKDAFMQLVINVIEANLSDSDFNVKKLAEELNMSQPTLYRKMKQHSDLTVVDIIRSVRVSKAASYIMDNKYSIQQISEMVGYVDTRTLRKHFIEHFGVSPSKYANGDI